MNKFERENIEWTNLWISDANTDKKRLMLIGDSTTRQIRGSVEILLNNIYSVDLFASSFAIYDEMLNNNIEMIFKSNDYKYDFIVLHYGGHHGFSRMCSCSEEYYVEYYKNYAKLVKFLLEKTKKVVLMTGTSEVMENNTGMIDTTLEDEIIVRNKIVVDIGQRYNCDVFDLYKLMKEKLNSFIYVDRQHFTREADICISYYLLNFIHSKHYIMEDSLVKLQCQINREKIWELCEKESEYFIYGAGYWGYIIYFILKWNGMEGNVNCIVVTGKDNKRKIDGKKVVSIYDINEKDRQNGVLIICSEKFEKEMECTAKELQFYHVLSYKDVLYTLK